MSKIRLDATLLSHFNLMDYSLLFVVCYNPNYVELHPDQFEVGKNGEFKLIEKIQQQKRHTEVQFKTKKLKRALKKEFLIKMAGMHEKEYEDEIQRQKKVLEENHKNILQFGGLIKD